MALQRPPQHRVDATPVFIHPEDPAWDLTRIADEIAEIEKENKERSRADRIEPRLEHPFWHYQNGTSRYDIDAPVMWRGKQVSAATYLRPDAEPTRFVLRRMSWDQFYRVKSLAQQNTMAAQILACRIGLKAVEGDDLNLDIDPDRAERSSEEMQRLFELDDELPLSIGEASYAASKPLTVAEKKASAS